MPEADTPPKPLPWWRRWLVPRFSLRTLLIVTTLVAVATGTWVARTRRQIAACQAVDDVGGEWSFAPWEIPVPSGEDSPPWWFETLPAVLREGSAEHAWRSVDRAFLPCRFPPSENRVKAIEAVASLPRLDVLSLYPPTSYRDRALERPISPEDRSRHERLWSAVGRMRSLRRLRANSQRIDEFAMAQIVGLPRLAHLDLAESKLDNDLLSRLSGVRSLESLDLASTLLNDQGAALVAALTQLEILNVSHTQVTPRGITSLGRLARLKELELQATTLDDEAAQAIAALANLRELTADGVRAVDETLALALGSPELRRVSLARTLAGPRTIAALAALPELESVSLEETPLEPGDLAPLATHPTLQRIHLPEGLPASDVVALLGCPRLTVGEIQSSRGFDRDDLLALSGASSPKTHVTISEVTMTTEDWRRLARSPTLDSLSILIGEKVRPCPPVRFGRGSMGAAKLPRPRTGDRRRRHRRDRADAGIDVSIDPPRAIHRRRLRQHALFAEARAVVVGRLP